MYDVNSIQSLKDRIGFGSHDLAIAIDAGNVEGTSGRTFKSFHRLVTLDNIYATTNKIGMDSTEFNAYLEEIKDDAVRSVLAKILNSNKSYLDGFDYSGTILLKPEIFEEAIGYEVAKMAIEQMISTTRVNIEERNASMAYQKLKIELEGARNDNGYYVAKGVGNELLFAIRTATDIIFPNGIFIYDKTDMW